MRKLELLVQVEYPDECHPIALKDALLNLVTEERCHFPEGAPTKHAAICMAVIDRQAEIEGWVKKLEAAGLAEDALDDLVHDAASQMGSSANNGGREAQIRLLVDLWDYETACRELQALLDAKGKAPEA